jgi:hypothetical protein
VVDIYKNGINIEVKKTARISWLAERFGRSKKINYTCLAECPISIPYKENYEVHRGLLRPYANVEEYV